MPLSDGRCLWYNPGMATLTHTVAFDRGTGPILRILSPEQARQVADYHADENLQHRIAELADRANEGELTEEERAEYEGYVQANRFVAVLQAQARKLLTSPSGP